MAFETIENLISCATTGAGKENIALFTAMRGLYNSRKNLKIWRGIGLDDAGMSAFKAVVSEVVTKMGDAPKEYGISVRELTVDENLTKSQTQIRVTNTER